MSVPPNTVVDFHFDGKLKLLLDAIKDFPIRKQSGCAKITAKIQFVEKITRILLTEKN